MKKNVYLVETNASREFWTLEPLPNGDDEHFYERTPNNDADEPVVAVLRALECAESYEAEDTSRVEDDSSWEGVGGNSCTVALTATEYEHLFDNVKIIDSREADF